jgi:hypothetical protein
VTEHYHAIVWIDHQQARVFQFNMEEADRQVIRPRHPERHIHHKANSIGSGHVAEDQDFFHQVTLAIRHAGALLITGPGAAKHELVKHIESHDPKLMEHVTAVETLDHPSDGALVAYARKYFRTADRMLSQRE